MENELFVAVIAGLGGMIGWGLADFFAKKTIDEIGDILSLTWAHIFGTLILFILLSYQLITDFHTNLPSGGRNWFLLSVFGVAQAMVYFFVYKGFGKGQIGILNPIFASFSGITALLSIIFFKEVISGYLIVGLVILFSGILLISLDINAIRSLRVRFSNIPGFREIIFATLLAAFWTLYWDKFVGGKDWLAYAVFMYTFMTLAILIIAQVRNVDLFSVKVGIWKYLILIGACEIIAYLAISLGYSLTSKTSIIALLSGAFSLPIIMLARIFLKEKITAIQTLGSSIIIAGIMVVSAL